MSAIAGQLLHGSVSMVSMLDTALCWKLQAMCCKHQRKCRPKKDIARMAAKQSAPIYGNQFDGLQHGQCGGWTQIFSSEASVPREC